jgi:hypothetical protein
VKSFPLVSSVVSAKFPEGAIIINYTVRTTRGLEEAKQQKVNHTRNEWRRCKTTLKASGEDVKLHSKRVEKM